MTNRILSLIMVLIMSTMFLSLPSTAEEDVALLSGESVLNLYPSDGSVINDAPEFFVADTSSCESITFILDGDVIGEASDEGKIEVNKLAFGKHTLRAVALMNDGTYVCEESVFEFKPKLISQSFSTDFNSYTAVSEPEGFYVWDQNKIIEKASVPGPSGEEGDKAVSLSIATDEALSWVGTYLHCSKFTNYDKDTVVFEFDIKPHSSTDSILVNNMYLWSGSFNLINSGKWLGTSIDATTEWHHVKIISDTVNKKISFILDGEVIKDSVAYSNYSNFKNTQFRISPNQTAKLPGEQHGGFTIDNPNFYIYSSYGGIVGLSYIKGGNEYGTQHTIPASTESLKFYLDNSVQIDTSSLSDNWINISTTDGQKIDISDINYNSDEGSVTITPSKSFPAGREFVLSVSDEIVFITGVPLGGSYELRFATSAKTIDTEASFTINGDGLYLSRQIVPASVVGADITATNVSGEDEEITYVIAAYKDERIVALNAKTLKLSADESQSITLVLPEIPDDGSYEICLMTCKNFDDIRAVSQYATVK